MLAVAMVAPVAPVVLLVVLTVVFVVVRRTTRVLGGAARSTLPRPTGSSTVVDRSAVAALILAGSATARAQPAPLVTLDVPTSGFDNDRGHVVAALFRPGANVLNPAAAFHTSRGGIHDRAARLAFPALPEGTYALVVFHDENDNGVVDHNVLRLPSEQLGFSNGFRPGIFAGMPTFEKLQFRIKCPPGSSSVVVPIVVR